MNLRNAILLGLGPKSDPSNLTRFERVVLFFTGPWMILPLGWALVRLGDNLFYWRELLPAERTRRPEVLPFFQGSNDLGGVGYGIAALALAVFAVTAAWHLSLRLRAFHERVGFGRRVGRAFAVLSPFFAVFLAATAFVVAETVLDRLEGRDGLGRTGLFVAGPSTDADIAVVFLTAAAVYALSVLFVAWLDGTRLRGPVKTLLAPAVAVLWFVLGADGQTPRAGQMLEASWEPLPAVRGARHGAMVAWNDLCLALMGFPARPVPPADSPLWFWTDGRLEFGPDADASPSARALRRRTDLPWVTEGRAFVVPVAVRDDTTARARAFFPYSTHARAYGGYFLQTPDGPFRILHGSIEPLWRYNDRWYFGWRDVHLRDGEPYWTLVLGADGCRGERKVVDLAAWAAVQTGTPCEPDAPAAPFVPAPQTERAAVSLRLESGATFASFTNLLLRLRDCGYGDVFVVE